MQFPYVIALGCAAALLCMFAYSHLVLARFAPPDDGGGRYRSIDGLRGYLATFVMFHHFVIWMQVTRLGGGWKAPETYLFNQFGVGAVALFFMITALLFHPFALAGAREVDWPKLYIKRVFRIVPAQAASIALVVGVILARGYHSLDLKTVGGALRWLTANGEPNLLGYPDSGRVNAYVLWSLKFEWQFYIFVLPLMSLAMAFRGRLPSWSLPAALLIGAMVADRWVTIVSIQPFLPLFAVGMLAQEIHSRGLLKEFFRARLSSVVALASLAVGVTIAPNPFGVSLPFFAIFFVCVANGTDLFGILTARGSRVLGEFSYSMYLMHGVVLSVFFSNLDWLRGNLSAEALPAWLPVVGLVVATLAFVSFLAIEKPMVDLGQRFVKALKR